MTKLINILMPDFEFADERGTLVQLVNKGYKQFNVIESKKGVLRGRHYHAHNTEAFYIISGSIELKVSNDIITEVFIFKAKDMFSIEANIMHSFNFLEDTLLISMYSEGVELPDGSKDILVRNKR